LNLEEAKTVFIVATAIVTLIVASPALSRLLVYPQTEFFTELWLLGPGHRAEGYPFNVSRGESYGVYLGVGNHLGYCAYYIVEVKFRNETQSAPDSVNHTPSSLPSLFNITAFVANGGVWEVPLTFSFNYEFNKKLSQVEFFTLTLNGVVLDLRGSASAWNATESRFYGNMVFELWIYNAGASDFQYHERFVDLKLNMTVSHWSPPMVG
jgi:hypothetical protein